ncbi:hypothetical protein HDV03_001177 [Kappamyces sp. JEL0829]|nr:hypothetical protein HDV03_001177 [Kappamyces sp. JEL0829]
MPLTSRFVDLSGRVLHPLLSYWDQNSKLTDVAYRLCQEFSVEPPNPLPTPKLTQFQPPPYSSNPMIHSSPAPNNYANSHTNVYYSPSQSSGQLLPYPSPNAQPEPAPYRTPGLPSPLAQGGSSPSIATGSPGSAKGGADIPPRPAKPPSMRSSPLPSSQMPAPKPTMPSLPAPVAAPKPDPALEQLELLRVQVRKKVEEYIQGFRQSGPMETERLVSISAHLSANSNFINDTHAQLTHIIGMAEKNIETCNHKIQELTASIQSLKERPEFDPDVDMKPLTVVEQQLADTVAECNATQDTIYYISKGFGSRSTDPDAFIKNVRALAREIFMKKVLIGKIQGVLYTARRGN